MEPRATSGKSGPAGSGQGTERTEVLVFGSFRFDQAERILHRNGTEVSLPPKALAVLEHLLQKPLSVVSKQDLLGAIWNGTAVTDQSLTQAVRVLRQVLEDDPLQPTYVETVHGRGFRFVADVQAGGNGDTTSGLGEAAPALGGTGDLETASGPTLSGRPLAWALGVVLFAAIAVVVMWQSRQNATPGSRLAGRFGIVAPSGWNVQALPSGPVLAVSPDGMTFAYAAWGRPSTSVPFMHGFYLVSADDLETRRVELSLRANRPFFSPDGRRLGFFSYYGIEVMSLDGEEIETICRDCGHFDRTTSRSGAGATWGTDDTIVFAHGKLFQIPAAGGTPVAVPTPDAYQEADHAWPSFLPGGSSVLVTIIEGEAIHKARIAVVALDTGQTRIVIENGTSARYVPTGHVVFGRDGDLLAVPFDLETLEVHGEPVVVVPGVMMNPRTGATQFSVSDDGTLFYQPGSLIGTNLSRLVAADRDGNIRIVSPEPRSYSSLAFSPDGRWLTAVIFGRGRNVWLYDVARRTWDQLTEGEADDDAAVWSPDSTQVAFASNRDGVRGVYVMPIDRSRPPELLMSSEHGLYPRSWSPDGILAVAAPGGEDLWMVTIDGSVEPELFEGTFDAQFSPNGRWIAHYGDADLPDEANFFISPYPSTGERLLVTDDMGVNMPQWSPDGRSIYFFSGVSLFVVAVETEPELRVGDPERLPFASLWYAVVPGGEEIVLAERVGPRTPQTKHLNVVRNWFEELQRLVPAEH